MSGHPKGTPQHVPNDEIPPGPARQFGSDTSLDLANERTFLAWVRTALALLGGSVAISGRVLHLAILLAVLAALAATAGLHRWHQVTETVRRGVPPPRHRTPSWLGAGLVLVALLNLVVVIGKALGV